MFEVGQWTSGLTMRLIAENLPKKMKLVVYMFDLLGDLNQTRRRFIFRTGFYVWRDRLSLGSTSLAVLT